MIHKLKRMIIGDPLPNWEYKHQRLSKKIALAVFSSDALSSVAYATEEIALVLITAGAAALSFSLPISLVIILLLWILIFSYRQTIAAYPKGGGAYIVAKDNLGTIPGLVAGAALLFAYVLTVSVSVAAGVAAITSALPGLYEERIIIAIFAIMVIMLMNLKGVKESGLVFSVPAFVFIFVFVLMVCFGYYRFFTGTLPVMPPAQSADIITGISLLLLFRAFSSGCAALTGIEAISDGVPAFKKPESKNARTTLVVMAVIMTFLFFGITFIGYHMKIVPQHDRTMVSIVAELLFGRGAAFYVIQAFTMLILFLAANTAFADFPRLSFFLAKDKFLPRQFTQLGDRLVFSNGIIALAFFSSLLIIVFHGSVHHLIPLYAIGVFTSFSLSQAGMIKRNLTLKKDKWRNAVAINSLGLAMTFVAVCIITVTRFFHGAWAVIIIIALMVTVFRNIKKHYDSVAEQLSINGMQKLKLRKTKHMVVIMIPTFHKGIIQALEFGKNITKDVVAVHVKISGSDTENLMKYWNKFKPPVKLVTIESHYRRILQPFLEYLDQIERKDPEMNVTVLIPEFVPKSWWQHFLHNQTGLALKTAIHFRPRTSYISVQYHLK